MLNLSRNVNQKLVLVRDGQVIATITVTRVVGGKQVGIGIDAPRVTSTTDRDATRADEALRGRASHATSIAHGDRALAQTCSSWNSFCPMSTRLPNGTV